MEESIQVINDCLVVNMPKEIDHHLADNIRKWVDLNIVRKKVQNVVFDFKDTKFMDSSGIGLILGRYKKIHCLGGKVMCINTGKRVQMLLEMSGVGKIAEILN